MEENENQKSVEAQGVNENKASTKPTNKIVETIKAKKKQIGIVIVAIIAILLIVDLICVSPKEAVKKCVSALGSGKSEKAFKYIDVAGMYVLSDLDEDDYDDFWDEYQDFLDSDDYEDLMEEMEDEMDDDYFEEIDEKLEDYDVTLKVSKISKVKKVGSHLYRVTAKLQVSYEGYDIGGTVYFYVMKKGTKSYIVGLDGDSISSSLLSSIY